MKSISVKEIPKILKSTPKTISVLFLGNPGIGKSEQVREFAKMEAKEMGKEFVDYDDSKYEMIMQNPNKYYVYVDLRLTELEPSDLSGIPILQGDSVLFAPLKFAKVLEKTAGLLFLDELTNVQRPDLQAVAYKLVLDRKVGFTKISNDVRIVAAGNTDENSSIAVPLPAPLLNRLAIYKVLIPTVDEWTGYMYAKYGTNWNTDIAAFLSMDQFKNLIYKSPKEPAGFEPFPTPRSWTMLALTKDPSLAPAYVGDEAGTTFINFLKFKNNLPDIKEIINEPEKLANYPIQSQYITAIGIVNMYFSDQLKIEKLTEVTGRLFKKLPVIAAFIVVKLKTVTESIESELSKKAMEAFEYWLTNSSKDEYAKIINQKLLELNEE